MFHMCYVKHHRLREEVSDPSIIFTLPFGCTAVPAISDPSIYSKVLCEEVSHASCEAVSHVM